MRRSYASGTAIVTEKSKGEVEKILRREGATAIVMGHDGDREAVLFQLNGKRIRIEVPVPPVSHAEYERDGRGSIRTQQARQTFYENERRRRWRALVLIIKAKFEAIASEITSFEQEFGMSIVVPNGQTVGEWAIPLLSKAYDAGIELPKMLPGR